MRVDPNPLWPVSLQEEIIKTGTNSEERPYEDRDRKCCLPVKEGPQKKSNPQTSWSPNSTLQNCDKVNFYCLSHTVGGNWLWEPYQINTVTIGYCSYCFLFEGRTWQLFLVPCRIFLQGELPLLFSECFCLSLSVMLPLFLKTFWFLYNLLPSSSTPSPTVILEIYMMFPSSLSLLQLIISSLDYCKDLPLRYT